MIETTDEERLATEQSLQRLDEHHRFWSKQNFWRKLVRYAKKAGQEVLEKALMLYYVGQSEHLPTHIKVMIFGALGYFISTFDAIPDFTPFMGFVDDLGILAAVLAGVSAWVSPEIQHKVDDKLQKVFKTQSKDDVEDAAIVDNES